MLEQMGTLSTLELMLEELQQVDEKTNDLPPPLPVRPVTKARLPKGRRKFGKEKSNVEEDAYSEVTWGMFGTKKEATNIDQPVHQWGSAERDVAAMPDKICLIVNLREGAGLNGVVGIQRCFRGYQTRRYYHELKAGVVALQSFVRGEISRKYYQGLARRLKAIIIIQKHIREHRRKRIKQQLAAVICLQSGIRGCLSRKQFKRNRELTCNQNIKEKNDLDKKEQETKVPCSVLLDLQRHILRTEAALERKKEENAALRLHIQQYEKKWNQYESKMKAMEKMWQDQLASMQRNLAAERKKHGDGKTVGQLRLLMLQDQDENEDNEFPRTTALQKTTLNISDEVHDTRPQQNGRSKFKNRLNNHHVMDMVNHFQNFVHDQCKLGQGSSTFGSDDELQKLKLKFEAWKKDYKNKLREVKATIKHRGHSEKGKGSKVWCGR